MAQETPVEDKNSFLRNDRRLVCSMFVIYGLCILGFVAATIWGLDRRSKTISANATSTAFAMATQHANATTTAIAHATEQAQYSLINRFDINRNNYRWRQGKEDNEYWSGYIAFENGVYVWEVKEVKKTFISWADFDRNEYVYDFDVYVDTKVMKGEPGDVCSGLIFRKAPSLSKKDDYYYFSLCNNSVARIRYHSDKDGWENIESISSVLAFPYSREWNRMEVSARGSHFVFLINGSKIYEMDDDRQKVGGIALAIELKEKTPARIVFDNFGLQYR